MIAHVEYRQVDRLTPDGIDSQTYLARLVSKGASGDMKNLFILFREHWQQRTVAVQLAKIIAEIITSHTRTFAF